MKPSEFQEIKPTGKIEPEVPKPNDELIGEKVHTPIYKKNGFKRVTGSIIMFIGGVLSVIPKTSLLGQGIFYAGSALLGVGMVHAHQKNKEGTTIPTTSGWIGFLQKVMEILKKVKK